MSDVLLNNVDSDEVSDGVRFGGGSKVIVVRADDFGGGVVSIEQKSAQDAADRWVAIAEFSSSGDKILENVVPGLFTRAVLSGSSGASNVYAELV